MSEYPEVLSGCAVRAEIQREKARNEHPIETAKKDGTLIALKVVGGAHPMDDVGPGDGWWTIGQNNFDNDGEDVWHFVGWCWSHDHFVDMRDHDEPGQPIAWRAFA